MVGRRNLKFDRLDQVMPEVDRLLAGSERAGSWSLGQILHHLGTAVRLTMSEAGTFSVEVPERSARAARLMFFRAGRFPDGLEVPHPAMIPPIDADPVIEAEALRSSLLQFVDHDRPFPVHPVLGPMSRDEWHAFHRIHCAHHLSFVRPTSPQSTPISGSGGVREGVLT